MKKLLPLVFSLISMTVIAQDMTKMMAALETSPSLEIKATSIKMGKEARPALTAYINASPDKVEKEWLKLVEDECQCDLKKSKGIYEGFGVRMATISGETLTVYTRVEEDEAGARLDVVVDFGGKFLTDKDTPTEAGKMRTFLRGFMKTFYVGWYEDVIEDERKEADKVAKDHEKIVKEGEKISKEIDSAHSDITKASEAITSAEKDIADLEVKIKELNTQIEKSKADISTFQKQAEKNAEAEAVKRAEVDAKNAQVEALKQSANSIKQ
jgi:hypothetical protein